MSELLQYCPDLFSYQRRESREVMVGHVGIGGRNPIRIQSMITSDTRDVEASVKQVLDLAKAGCEIVRITAQTRKYAEFLKPISDQVRAAGVEVPLVADIHFKPDAAMEAAKWVEKVRVNPGNYADKKKFEIREYTDAQYAEELELCKEKGRAMRIGTNHGSLSDRIMNRYGDTPLGMVESALEFARLAREFDYHNFVFSMKASNPKVMIEAYRLLVARLYELGADWNYPLHLGVTEAGDGEDGRIKSAIGIGSLLADGVGDTIRVSLTEDAVHEIPVAQALVQSMGATHPDREMELAATMPWKEVPVSWDPFSYQRRRTAIVNCGDVAVGRTELMRVFTSRKKFEAVKHKLAGLGDFQPEVVYEDANVLEIDPRNDEEVAAANALSDRQLITVRDGLEMEVIPAFRLLAARIQKQHPILLKDVLTASSDAHKDFADTLLEGAKNLGSLICDGIGDAILVQGEVAPGQSLRLSYNILQAAGARIFKTDYVACPSCGRTLFDLQDTTQSIRAATGHLKGVRIAIMGCIVNGPGEMADADFGYVGGAPGKINLYVGKQPVKFNIPETEAVDRLVDLIKEHDRWVEAPEPVAEEV
jgi:(E)-4-hydroxy-3-methylbut-2-enyl-diphosphate synthase